MKKSYAFFLYLIHSEPNKIPWFLLTFVTSKAKNNSEEKKKNSGENEHA